MVLLLVSALWSNVNGIYYLSDEVESNHISRLSGHRVRCELELVVCGNGNGHRCCRGEEALRDRSDEDRFEHHVEVVGSRDV